MRTVHGMHWACFDLIIWAIQHDINEHSTDSFQFRMIVTACINAAGIKSINCLKSQSAKTDRKDEEVWWMQNTEAVGNSLLCKLFSACNQPRTE